MTATKSSINEQSSHWFNILSSFGKRFLNPQKKTKKSKFCFWKCLPIKFCTSGTHSRWAPWYSTDIASCKSAWVWQHIHLSMCKCRLTSKLFKSNTSCPFLGSRLRLLLSATVVIVFMALRILRKTPARFCLAELESGCLRKV